jgi:hypothetical protein
MATIDPTTGGLSGTYQASPTSTNVTQTTIPEWASPYLASQLQRAYNLSFEGYHPYSGQMYAGINPLQQQAWGNLAGMSTSPLSGQAAGLAGLAGTTSLLAGQNYANQVTNPFAVRSYMSPYAQNVVDVQKQQAISDYGRMMPTMGANAARVGGLGGTRNALVQAEGQRNLGNQLQGIQATGLQNAYQSAMQNMQNAANFGLQGYGQAASSANILGGLGQQQVQQALDINKAQQAAGADIRAVEQQPLSAQYQQFLDEQNLPYKQIGFMSDILRGTPLAGSSATSTYAAPPSTLGQLAGLGVGLGALLKSG